MLWSEGEFTEGPAVGPDRYAYSPDVGNRLMKFAPKAGKTTEYRNPGGRLNGLEFAPLLLLVSAGCLPRVSGTTGIIGL
jgi:sugar lactone lactonase YvrE